MPFTVTSTLGLLLSLYQLDKTEGIDLALAAIENAQNAKTTPTIPTEALMKGVIKPAREKLNAVPHCSHYRTHLNVVFCPAVLGSKHHHSVLHRVPCP